MSSSTNDKDKVLTPATPNSTPPQQGSGGNAGGNYTGTMKATDPTGKEVEAKYEGGKLVSELASGSVVHTAGGDYVYNKPAATPPAATPPATTPPATTPPATTPPATTPTGEPGPDRPVSEWQEWYDANQAKEEEKIDKGALSLNPWYTTMERWFNRATKQQENAVDYATKQGIAELERAEADAQLQFQAQRNQVDADEAKAKDNQALYSEARGDKGGIGAAQYDSIMNTAAQNRLLVNQAQTKLATDTARQIADLRAQGEFQKADALLELTQTYLSQLVSMEQWAFNYHLSVEQFNQQVKEWDKEYSLKVADLTGLYNGKLTMSGQSYVHSLLDEGIIPDKAYLDAAGMDYTEAAAIAAASRNGVAVNYDYEETCVKTAKDMAEEEGPAEARRYLYNCAMQGLINPSKLYSLIVANIGGLPEMTYSSVKSAISGSGKAPVPEYVFPDSNLVDEYATYEDYLLSMYLRYAAD